MRLYCRLYVKYTNCYWCTAEVLFHAAKPGGSGWNQPTVACLCVPTLPQCVSWKHPWVGASLPPGFQFWVQPLGEFNFETTSQGGIHFWSYTLEGFTFSNHPRGRDVLKYLAGKFHFWNHPLGSFIFESTPWEVSNVKPFQERVSNAKPSSQMKTSPGGNFLKVSSKQTTA